MTTTEDRAAYIEGLRRIADALEADPGLPLPDTGRDHGTPLYVFVHASGSREQAVAWARLLDPGATQTCEAGPLGFHLDGHIAGVSVALRANPSLLATSAREVTRTEYDVEQLVGAAS